MAVFTSVGSEGMNEPFLPCWDGEAWYWKVQKYLPATWGIQAKMKKKVLQKYLASEGSMLSFLLLSGPPEDVA